MRQRHAVPRAIHDAHVRRVGRLGRSEADTDILSPIDTLAPHLGARLARHLRQGQRDKLGVTQVPVAVGKGRLHRHRDPVDVGRRVVPQRADIVPLQDVEDRQQSRAAVRGRRGADRVVPIRTRDHVRLAQLVVGEIVAYHEAPVGSQVLGHPARELPVIEAVRSLLGQLAQCARIVRVAQHLTRFIRAAVRVKEDAPCLVVGLDPVQQRAGLSVFAAHLPTESEVGVNFEPLSCHSGGWLNKRLPGHRAPARLHRGQSPDGTGGADRLVSDIVDLTLHEIAPAVRIRPDGDIRPHLGRDQRPGQGRRVQADGPGLVSNHPIRGQMHRQDRVAADATHLRADHGLNESTGHRSVNRVPARHQYLCPRLHSHGLGGHDHTRHATTSFRRVPR